MTLTALPKQLQFIKSAVRYVCYSGGVGSGKTRAGCMKALMLSLKYPGNFGLIGTQTYPQLRDTTMRTFFDEVCDPKLIKSFNKVDGIVKLINGSSILFRTLDEESKLRSLNLGWFFIDESTTISERIFLQLKTRLRLPNVPFHYGFCATNPDSFNNWNYRHFVNKETKDSEMIFSRTNDNPFLPQSYIEDLESISDPDYKLRFIQGQWGQLEGVVYKEFSRANHILPSDWTPDWSNMDVYRGIDFGFVNPFVCLWFAVDKEDRVYCFDEYYKSKVIIDKHVEEIEGRYPNKYIHRTYYDPADPEGAVKMKSFGVNGLRPANNSVSQGIQAVKRFFSNKADERPGLMIHPRCVNLINELENYKWEEDKGDKNSKETPLKTNDHACDALRYFIHSRFKGTYIKEETPDE